MHIRSTKHESSALCTLQKAFWYFRLGRALQAWSGRRFAEKVDFQNKNVYFGRNTKEVLQYIHLKKTRLEKAA